MLKLQKRYDALRKQLDNIKFELDAKVLHCEKLKEERDALRQKFEEAVLNVQQRSSMYDLKCPFYLVILTNFSFLSFERP